jgi:hypothetical protein
MKALSLRQPWLWAVLDLGKTIENRRWNTHYRGPILLHAAKGCTVVECGEGVRQIKAMAGIDWRTDPRWPGFEKLERGGICGYAEIVNVVPPCALPGLRPETDELRWHMPEQFGFVLRNVRRLPFTPCRGFQRWFEIPDAHELFDVPELQGRT